MVGLPLLLLGQPHDAVTQVAVLADDVGEGVVQVVVAVLPVLGGCGVVPVPGGRVDLRVAHPVPLAVHDVVAELHVLEDLRGAQHRRPGQPRGRQDRGEQGHPAAALEIAVDLHDLPDVRRVVGPPAGQDLIPDGVELDPDRLDVFVAEVGQGVRPGIDRVVGPDVEGSCGGHGGSFSHGGGHRSMAQSPAGAETQVWMRSPGSPRMSPVRRSRTWPCSSGATQL